MSPTLGPYDLPGAYTGDAVDMMREIPDGSIHCCITSPPYWGLRSYLEPDDPDKAREIGAEATPDQYVASMVRVFSEVRRVLRDDGVCWLNLGDCYSSKQLALLPYRVALALQDDGWLLRSNIVWAKGLSFCEHYSGRVMPESIRDRPTSAHEAVFLLTKSERYYYDQDAVREPDSGLPSGNKERFMASSVGERQRTQTALGSSVPWQPGGGRNLRNVWAISPQAYTGSHYAVFPPQLVAPMVEAGCPPKVCAECGAPWVRRIHHVPIVAKRSGKTAEKIKAGLATAISGAAGRTSPIRQTLGWDATCDHGSVTSPGVCLDPFMGSGTTGQVAEDRGRLWIGFDLDERNATLIRKRTAQTSLLGLVGQ